MKFGDLVCYRGGRTHGAPLMFVGPCRHTRASWLLGDIDLLDLQSPSGHIEHKDAPMWRICTHIVDGAGSTPLGVARGSGFVGVDLADGDSITLSYDITL